MKFEIEYNIIEQLIKIYAFDDKYFYHYNKDKISYSEKDPFTLNENLEFISLPPELADDLFESIVKFQNKKINKIPVPEVGEHVKDLRWVLGHFMKKDT
jgi:hypothetical protein